MFVRLITPKCLAFMLLLAGCCSFQMTGVAHAENAVQKAADRASHDRWARSEPSSAHHSKSDDDDEDDDADNHHHSKDKELAFGHAGELNGHLSMKGW